MSVIHKTRNIAKVPSADGISLLDYTGPDTLTLGGEIDKLASNLAYARQSAGIHYRSDSEGGLEVRGFVVGRPSCLVHYDIEMLTHS